MLDNVTPFGAAAAFAYGLDDVAMVVLCVAGRFRLPRAGTAEDGPLELADEQPAPPMADSHLANPAESSLHVPGQCVPDRPGAEVYLHGSAWARAGKPVTELRTRLRVGTCRKEVHLLGDRWWVHTATGIGATKPEPFVRLPLVYERSYGGTGRDADGRIVVQEARNPIGRGCYATAEDAAHKALPNLELPGERIGAWNDRATPWGYGAVPGSWQPRLAWAGTYDEAWAEQRAPLWPRDADNRYFCAAAPGLAASDPFRGGEPVLLDGFSPDGVISFRLPEMRLVAKSYYALSEARGEMALEGVLLEPDHGAVTLFWRRAIPMGPPANLHLASVLRLLEPWEELA
ncbi:MAG: DUF2169 domain-containing protein [Geminicoccaceae bacterium]